MVSIFLTCHMAFCQEEESIGLRTITNNNVECNASDFQLEIGNERFDASSNALGIFKKSGSGFVCQEALPAIITIYSKITGLPLTSPDVIWEGNIEGNYGSSNQALLTEAHFNNTDFAIFSVRFTDNGNSVEIRNFKVSKDIRTYALRKNNTSMIFDDVRDQSGNYIDVYWPSHTPAKERPWLFVPTGSTQNIKLSVKNKKQKPAGKDAWKVVPVSKTGNGATINPNQFSGDDSDFSAGQSISTSSPYPFIGSCGFDTVAYLYSRPSVNYGLEFKLLAFTHDDVQVNYGPVASDTTLCVAVGPDGYYSGAFKVPTYYNSNDSIIWGYLGNIRYIQKIVAGKDKTCDSDLPSAPYTFYNTLPDYNQWISECNSIYNQIDVHFTFISYDTLYLPEFYTANKQLDAVEMTVLDKLIHVTDPENIIVYMTNSIYNSNGTLSTRGRATEFGVPKVAVASFADGYTLAHEIGHGKFSLRHPDNDILHLVLNVDIDGEYSPDEGTFMVPDIQNFMFSAYNFRFNRIRQYQWKKILTGKYGN